MAKPQQNTLNSLSTRKLHLPTFRIYSQEETLQLFSFSSHNFFQDSKIQSYRKYIHGKQGFPNYQVHDLGQFPNLSETQFFICKMGRHVPTSLCWKDEVRQSKTTAGPTVNPKAWRITLPPSQSVDYHNVTVQRQALFRLLHIPLLLPGAAAIFLLKSMQSTCLTATQPSSLLRSDLRLRTRCGDPRNLSTQRTTT